MIVINMRNKKKYDVEVATKLKDLRKGLSGRESLGKNKGMFFDFGYKRRHGIWMLRMKFPIEIAFINDAGKIVDVYSAEPISLDPKTWKIYYSKEWVRYVLEVSGDAGLAEGDIIEWIDSKGQLKE
ncbi:DUF192 domain-containing protein [Candidatus Undinarchaeota archaeon]